MENNEKLLEAARMLKTHCEKMEDCGKCCFIYGTANDLHCGISTSAGVPCGWRLPNTARWTPADKSLAAGLKANGYNSVTRMHGSESVLVMGRSQTALELGKGVFANLQLGEVVNLDDIIGEGHK